MNANPRADSLKIVGDPLDSIRKLTQAWIKKDPEEMSRWLSDDIVEIGPAFSSALSGKQAFFRSYRDYLEGPMRILSYRISRVGRVEISASRLLVYFHYRMRTETAGTTEESRGKESMLLKRARGQWVVRFIHWHRDTDEE